MASRTLSKNAKRAEARRKDELQKQQKKLDRLGVSSLPQKKKHTAKSKRGK